jgi:3-dehydroquinate dehydratase type I
LKICTPLTASSTQETLELISRANQEQRVDLIEIWAGEIGDLDLEKLFKASKKPLLINCKDASEKGNFTGSPEEKLEILSTSARLGAAYIDLAGDTTPEAITKLKSINSQTQLILSLHFWHNTPKLPNLLNQSKRLIKAGADLVKIATFASDPEDLVTIFRFAAKMRREKTPYIALAMGKLGQSSRFLIPTIFGSEFTFAPLANTRSTAPGQLSLEQLSTLQTILT